jgi:hypothetical protein
MPCNWSCPIPIDSGLAQGIQCILVGLDSWKLTEENLAAFVAYNKERKILYATENGVKVYGEAEDFREFIGFTYHY